MCLWLHVSVAIQFPALTVTLTYALLQMVKKIAGKSDKARMITKARVTELIMSGGACLMNVWISARRNRDEDEDVFVFLLTGATSLYGGEINGILTVLFRFLGYGFRLAMCSVNWMEAREFAILVPDPIAFAPGQAL